MSLLDKVYVVYHYKWDHNREYLDKIFISKEMAESYIEHLLKSTNRHPFDNFRCIAYEITQEF